MMDEITLLEIEKLEQRKQELLQAIEFTKEKKQEVIKIPQILLSQLNSGRISKQEYEEKLNKSLKKRTTKQWIKYYEDYITYYNYQVDLCNRLIKQEKIKIREQSKKSKTKLILKIIIIFVLIAIFISLIFIFRQNIVNVFEGLGEEISSIGLSPAEVKEQEELTKPETPIKLKDNQAIIEEESLSQHQAVIGKPVKWEKQIKLDSESGFDIELPKNSKNIKVKSNNQDVEFQEDTQFFSRKKQVIVKEKKKDYEIEFETPAPEIEEEVIGKNKRIIIIGPDNIHYENVLSFAELVNEIPESEINKIRIYEVIDGKNISIPFTAYDTNENGLLDYVEWITLSLSQAEFLMVQIKVLNVQSYPTVGGNWTVRFTTIGTADLKITAVNGTTWSNSNENEDLKFLKIKCENQTLDYEWINDSVFIQNYSCENKTSFETSKVLTSGKHHLEFNFGGEKALAHNRAVDYTIGMLGDEGNCIDETGDWVTWLENKGFTVNCIDPISPGDLSGLDLLACANDDDCVYMNNVDCPECINEVESNGMPFMSLGQTDCEAESGAGHWSSDGSSYTKEIFEVQVDTHPIMEDNGFSGRITFSSDGDTEACVENERLNSDFITIARYDRIAGTGIFVREGDSTYGTWVVLNLIDGPSLSTLNSNGEDLAFSSVCYAIDGTTDCFVSNELPKNIECNAGSCDITIDDSINIEAFGSIAQDPITYFIEANYSKETCVNAPASDCSNCNQAECNAGCSLAGCSWGIGGLEETVIHFTGFEADDTAPWDGWSDEGGDVQRTSAQSYCTDNSCDNGGTYSIEVQDDTATSYTAQTFDLSAPCDGNTCDQINLNVYLFPDSFDNANEGFDIWCDYGTGSAVEIADWKDSGIAGRTICGVEVPENTWTKVECDISSICNIDSTVEIRFTSDDSGSGGNRDQVFIDGINIVGYKASITPSCFGTLDCPILGDQTNCENIYGQCSWETLKQWWQIGNHLPGTPLPWDTSSIMAQPDISLRATIYTDPAGSNDYFILDPDPPFLEIKHLPEIVYISDINGKLSGDVTPLDRDFDNPGAMTEKTFDIYVHHGGDTFNDLPLVISDNEDVNLTLINKLDQSIKRTSEEVGFCTFKEDIPAEAGKGCPAGSIDYVEDDCRVYTCTVNMRYYDNPFSITNWTVNVSVKDLSGNIDSDTNANNLEQPMRQTYFNDFPNFDIIGGNLVFGTVEYGIQATQPENADYPIQINNTGNVEISGTNITAYDIPATIPSSSKILAKWFNASGNINPCENVLTLSNGISIGSGLPPISPKTEALGETIEDLRICLFFIDPIIEPIDYSTQASGGTNWDISAVYVLVAITIKSKKKKRKLKRKAKQKSKKTNIKIPENDNLLKALDLITDELKQEYSLNKKEIIEVIVGKLKQKYKINKNEVLNLIKTENKIPIEIFSKELGGLEAISKYLKENKNMSYHKIANILQRNERTIWTAYNKAKQKQNKNIKIKQSENSIPINIFENKKLTILESIITYLKEQGLKYSEIARLLNRDQRNIWTIYSRAIKK